MAFMKPYIYKGDMFDVTNTQGESTLVPADLVPDNPQPEHFTDYIEWGTPATFEHVSGWFACLSAPGYMDCTNWSGPFATEEEAKEYLRDTYGDDEEEDDQPRTPSQEPSQPPRQCYFFAAYTASVALYWIE